MGKKKGDKNGRRRTRISELERVYIPDGMVVEVGDRVYKNDELVGYELTIEAQYNATLVGMAKLWSTRLKT